MELLSAIVTAISILAGVIVSMFYARRAKKAEVYAKELENAAGYISNADKMIDLVKKANAEVVLSNEKLINTLQEENEKTRKSIGKLERAIKQIDRCSYRNQCPVYDELQKLEGNCADGGKNNRRNNHRNHSGHDDRNSERPGADPGAAGV